MPAAEALNGHKTNDGHRIHWMDHWFPGLKQQTKLTSKPQLDHKYASKRLQVKCDTVTVYLPQCLEERQSKWSGKAER